MLLVVGISSQLVTMLLLHDSIENPYRQPKQLYRYNTSLSVGTVDSVLYLHKDFSRYIREVKNIANVAGFREETPMIDLSGISPGLHYAIGARNVVSAWFIGGYSNSDGYVRSKLINVACSTSARAWLLVEPYGPRRISSDVISSFGADIVKDYDVVGEFWTPEKTSGYKYKGSRFQQLLKPNRAYNTAVESCENAKMNQQTQ